MRAWFQPDDLLRSSDACGYVGRISDCAMAACRRLLASSIVHRARHRLQYFVYSLLRLPRLFATARAARRVKRLSNQRDQSRESEDSRFRPCPSSGGLRRSWTRRTRCGPSAAPPSPNSTPSPNPSSSTCSATRRRIRRVADIRIWLIVADIRGGANLEPDDVSRLAFRFAKVLSSLGRIA